MEKRIFFFSDPHFGHKNILKYCPRPYADLVEMERELVKNYNETVGPNDVCYWLGDCFFCGTLKATEIMKKLNGYKILIRGNHDWSAEKMKKVGFDEVHDKGEIWIDGTHINLCHFPYKPRTDDINPKVLDRIQQLKAEARATGNDSKSQFNAAATEFVTQGLLTEEQLERLVSHDMRYWSRRYEDNGNWLLCGHVHSSWAQKNKMINVGVDVRNYRPISLEEIKEIINGGK